MNRRPPAGRSPVHGRYGQGSGGAGAYLRFICRAVTLLRPVQVSGAVFLT